MVEIYQETKKSPKSQMLLINLQKGDETVNTLLEIIYKSLHKITKSEKWLTRFLDVEKQRWTLPCVFNPTQTQSPEPFGIKYLENRQ